MLLLISRSICSEYCDMKKITYTSIVKKVRNIEPKFWSQMSGPGSGLLVLESGPGIESQVLSFASWMLACRSRVFDPSPFSGYYKV